MFRHIVLLHWKENTPAEAVQAVTAAYKQLRRLIPEIHSYQFGHDLKLYESNADYALVADFADEEDFRRYVAHPAHAELMADVSMPIMASDSSVQFQY